MSLGSLPITLDKGLRPVEKRFVFLVLFLASGALIGWYIWPHFNNTVTIDPDGNSIIRLLWGSADFGIALLVWRHWESVKRAALANKAFAAFVGYAVLSAMWSTSTGSSLRQVIGLLAAACLGFVLAAKFSIESVLRILSRVLSTGMVASCLASVVVPALSVGAGGVWRGAYLQKNLLGRAAALCIIVLLVRMFAGQSRKWILPQLAIAGLALMKSASATSILDVTFAVSALFVLRAWFYGVKRELVLYLAFCAVMLGLTAFIVYGASPSSVILGMFDKDSTLSSRTLIWSAVMPFIHQKLWIGWGYGGFWRGWGGPSGSVWYQLPYVRPAHSHNAYLELVLSFGVVGAALFAWALVRTAARSLRAAQLSMIKLFFPGFLAFMLIDGLGENAFIGHESINWMLLSYVVAAVSLESPDHGRAGRLCQKTGEPAETY